MTAFFKSTQITSDKKFPDHFLSVGIRDIVVYDHLLWQQNTLLHKQLETQNGTETLTMITNLKRVARRASLQFKSNNTKTNSPTSDTARSDDEQDDSGEFGYLMPRSVGLTQSCHVRSDNKLNRRASTGGSGGGLPKRASSFSQKDSLPKLDLNDSANFRFATMLISPEQNERIKKAKSRRRNSTNMVIAEDKVDTTPCRRNSTNMVIAKDKVDTIPSGSAHSIEEMSPTKARRHSLTYSVTEHQPKALYTVKSVRSGTTSKTLHTPALSKPPNLRGQRRHPPIDKTLTRDTSLLSVSSSHSHSSTFSSTGWSVTGSRRKKLLQNVSGHSTKSIDSFDSLDSELSFG